MSGSHAREQSKRDRERERPNACHSLTQWVVGRAYGLRVGMPTPTPCRKKERKKERESQSKAKPARKNFGEVDFGAEAEAETEPSEPLQLIVGPQGSRWRRGTLRCDADAGRFALTRGGRQKARLKSPRGRCLSPRPRPVVVPESSGLTQQSGAGCA